MDIPFSSDKGSIDLKGQPFARGDQDEGIKGTGKMIKYYDDKTVSEITGRSLSALRKDRLKGKGIPYLKVGRQVRYVEHDVFSFMEGCRVRVKPLTMTEV